ncbi:murein L,D-transpeptidase [Loktanella sp. IMCC34160]|uniref:L,D-transpeptidase family protein n=1 Tax=Loktanella sp. IMCC34160 TaxID=2510646 RepID=UPI00101B9141|nr:L,D-transpeptidase family protein [Loktanella sp. IMCC34160]RYG92331.1 murein L,D-transpeptidase [Loktanella sp. IMCC34160]
MFSTANLRPVTFLGVFLTVFLSFLTISGPAAAQVTAFRQAVAEAAARDDDLATFYRGREFEGIWTGSTAADRNRRNALMRAFAGAGDHGLPMGRYDADAIMARLEAAQTPAEKGAMEVELSRLFLQYARDIQTGMLTPRSIDSGLVREVPLRPRLGTIQAFAQSNPQSFLRSLPPSSPEYARLLREKIRLERLLANGGWGPVVPARSLEPGDSGNAVVALRNRLILMGFMDRSATQSYDASVQSAVQRFQQSHGLNADGVAGQSTMDEINVQLEQRLQSVIVAMERERWLNRPRGARHIWVNLTDFTAAIVDNDRVSFVTRSVVGANASDRRSPEFSDVMEFMVVNPSWYVPRSIIVNEYLPQLQRNPNAAGQLLITDSRGRAVSRGSVDFTQYNARTFPFSMRQPPSNGNALGLVKFMFPNPYNIYLHDTPAKSLFSREVRAYSHGCIRLNDPFDFAYALLARQTNNPEEYFQSILRTGNETRVDLADPVPVHIVYRTAFTNVTGSLQFRRDVYGRDRQIWNALAREGVAVRAVQG